jgi:hypothetical protein
MMPRGNETARLHSGWVSLQDVTYGLLTVQKSSYISMQHYFLLSRNLLYTGLTRARQLAMLVGPTKAIGFSIKRVTDRQRYTALADRLKGLSASPTV